MAIYMNEFKSACNRYTCTLMFIATLLIVAKLWNQPGCPSADEWIKKMYTYNREYYLTLKTIQFCILQENEWN
jgi:hypothetical protein